MSYGFTVNMEGNVLKTAKDFEAALASMGVKAKVEAQKVESAFAGMGSKIKGVLHEYKGLITGTLMAGGILGGIEFIKSSIEAYDKLEKAVTRVNTVIQSTNGAAGLSANMIEEQAKALSKGILQGRGEIMDAQGMLLSFTGIRGPIFEETTKAVADFATFYKTDMTTAALAIGKAMNDPAKGMTKLQRQGVTFTEEQKKQVKLYQDQGKLALAQGVILKELKTEFGGQAGAATTTDAGKVEMAKKQWGSLKLMIGEVFSKIQASLVPAFSEFVKYVKVAFNSAPLQFFLHHIKDLVAVMLKLLPIWLGYKAVMFAVNAAKSVYATVTRTVTSALTAEASATEGSAAATKGLSGAIASIGLSAFVIVLGLAIEKFIQWNTEINDTVEQLTKVKDITQGFSASHEAADKINLALSGSLNEKQKSGVLSDINAQIQEIQDKIATEVSPAMNKSVGDVDKYREYKGQNSPLEYIKAAFRGMVNDPSAMNNVGMGKFYDGMVKASKDISHSLSGYNTDLKKLQAQQKALMGAGVKPLKYTPGGEVHKNALSTSELAGAKGGLGEAKVINIRIDTMQKVSVANGAGWKDVSQNATEILLRTLNNIAYSQSQTM